MKSAQSLARSLVVICCAAIVTVADLLGGFEWLELKTLDLRFNAADAVFAAPSSVHRKPDDIAIIAVDPESEKRIEEPLILWDRHFARVIRAAADAGARVIAIDFLWTKSIERFLPGPDPSRRHELTKALLYAQREKGVALVMAAAVPGLPPLREHVAVIGPANFGLINTTPDRDKLIRRQALRFGIQGEDIPSLALLAVRRFLGDGDGTFADTVQIDFRVRRVFEQIPFHEVLARASGKGPKTPLPLKGKIVLLGSMSDTEDVHATPLGRETPGLLIHANTIATLLDRSWLVPWGPAPRALAVAFLAAIVGWICFSLTSMWGVVMAGAIAVLFGCLSVVSLRLGFIAGLAAPLASIALTTGTVYGYRFVVEEREKRWTMAALRRYVSDSVAAEILRHPGGVALKGKRMRVAVLFADIRGFTTFAEKEAPEYVVRHLNEYLAAMTAVILDRGGTIDKFIGDGMMAYFGAPLPDPDAPAKAVETGLAMLERLKGLNKKWSSKHQFVMNIGVGIHCGDAIVGSIGSGRRMGYGPLGDVVNVASRVEGLTKVFGRQMIVSKAVYENVRTRVDAEPLGEAQIKGHTPVQVYAVSGLRKSAAAEEVSKT